MKFDDIFMKAYPQKAKGVKADQIPWDNPNYIFETKYDGDRRLVYFTKDGNRNTSRSKSASTGLPVEKTDNVPHIRDLIIPELDGTILDGEFIHNRGFQNGVRKIMGCLPDKAIERQNKWGLIELMLFDVIAYKGELLIDEPLLKRKEILQEIYLNYFINIPFINLVEINHGTPDRLQERLNEIINDGGEGMVAKDINSKYRLSTEKCLSPLKNAWIKIKKEFNGDFVILGFDEASREYTGDHLDTHQYWMDYGGEKIILNGQKEVEKYMKIMGKPVIPITKYYFNDWIGAIRFGEYENGKLVERGSCSGMTEEIRAKLSANPEKYIGKVIEISGMERIENTKAVRQPVFIRFRNDKTPEDCIYELQKG